MCILYDTEPGYVRASILRIKRVLLKFNLSYYIISKVMGYLINDNDVVMSDKVVTGHNIHSKGKEYHDRNTDIETHLKDNMQILAQMQDVYLKIMEGYSSTIGVVKGVGRSESVSSATTDKEAFYQLMPGLQLSSTTMINSGATLQNVLKDHHNYLYNKTPLIAADKTTKSMEGRELRNAVYGESDPTRRKPLSGDALKSLIAYYQDRDTRNTDSTGTGGTGTRKVDAIIYDVNGNFGKNGTTLDDDSELTDSGGDIIYTPIWFDSANAKANALYYYDFVSTVKPSGVTSGDWSEIYKTIPTTGSLPNTCPPADNQLESSAPAAAAVPVFPSGGNFNQHLNMARKMIDCDGSQEQNNRNILNSSYYKDSTSSSEIIAWDTTNNGTNNMGGNTIKATITGTGLVDNNTSSLRDNTTTGEEIFLYCPGIVLRYDAIFNYSPDTNGSPNKAGRKSGVAHYLNLDNFTNDNATNIEYIQVYYNGTTDGKDYYAITDMVQITGTSTDLVPNYFAYNGTSDDYISDKASEFTVRLYARRKKTSTTVSKISSCVTLINDVPGKLEVLKEPPKTLGDAATRLSKQVGYTASEEKWCGARSKINVQARHLLAMTYLIRFHTLFIQRELQLMNYYQYGTVVYIDDNGVSIKEFFKRGDDGKAVRVTDYYTTDRDAFSKGFSNLKNSLDENVYIKDNGDQVQVSELQPHKPFNKDSTKASPLYIVLPKKSGYVIDVISENPNNNKYFDFKSKESIDYIRVLSDDPTNLVDTPNQLESMFYLVEWTKKNVDKARHLSSGRAFQGLNFDMYKKLGEDLKRSYDMADNDIQEINKLHAMQEDLTAIGNKNYYMMMIYMVILFFLLVSIYYISKQ
jgi:hypothetical protein